MREELKRLQRKLGITTIFVTHDQLEAMATSDRIAVMDGGVIAQVGSPAALYDDPINRFVASFVGSTNLLPARVKPVDETLEPLTRDTRTVLVESALFGDIVVPAVGFPSAGQIGEISIRPLSLELSAPGTSRPSARASDIVIHGQVQYSEFMGDVVRYHVSVGSIGGGAASTTLIVDQSHRAHTPQFADGVAVRVAAGRTEFRFLAATN